MSDLAAAILWSSIVRTIGRRSNSGKQYSMSSPIRILIAALTCHVASGMLIAQDTERLIPVLKAKIPQLMKDGHVPGLSMVLIRENRIVWSGSFGVRTAGRPEKVDDQTVFEAASMSKPLFSYGALKLSENGRLDLDSPLDSYLPEPYLPDQPLARTITARMVMLHRTGLPNWREGGWRSGQPLRVDKKPDTCFTYSGEGYTYLQTAIEHLTKQPTAAWMEASVLVPLKMSRSSYEWQDPLKTDFAGGHDKNGNFKKGRRFYEQGNAAYSLYTTPTDYARFLIEMMRRDRSADHSLKAETIEKMTTLQVQPDKDNPRSRRSLGWVIGTEANGGWVNHSGSNGSGFQCNSRFNMKRQSGSVIMTNSSNGREVWEGILGIIDSESPENKPAAEDQPVDKNGKFATWGSQSRTVRYEYRLMNPTSKPATKIDVYVPLPLESPRQQIHYLHLPQSKPHRVITDRHGQRLVHYTFDRLEAGEWVDLGYVVGITLRNMRWIVSGPSPSERTPVLAPEARELYLKSETNYSMETGLMREAAASLIEGATTDFEKLVRIHDYVTSSIRYVRDGRWDPAATVLSRGTGSCSEYNYVLSGLCRLAGLPTRCVGGTSNGLRDLPTTDAVFHRWTEVFLSGFGWFPADCSRDANPIRGKRSHFGRVYVDAMVWCRQAGGNDDSLGWDYRAKAHVKGDDPGIRENHRTRWFVLHPEEEVEAAYTWLVDGAGPRPKPDLLECALLRWEKASVQNRRKMIHALADSGRNACLRRAATLPETDQLRETCVRELCLSPDLAGIALERSRDLYRFRNWFRSNESSLLPAGEGRFKLTPHAATKETPTTTASSSTIWTGLVPEVVNRLRESVEMTKQKSVVIMPVTDQTLAGLGGQGGSILAALKEGVSQETGVKLIDQDRFDRWMTEQGPGGGEYWILANGGSNEMPPELAPDIILTPVCITSREKESVLYHLELKVLELSNCKYSKAVARVRRTAEKEPQSDRGVLVGGGDTVLARWEHDLVSRNGYDWPLAGVKDVLSAADAAFCNLECCVSLKGAPTEKGDRCPFYYRARPEMLRCLTQAGIDIVTAANNHGGDYGPVSVADTAKWCEKAGLVCVGNGNNSSAAEEPRLVCIGPVRVGFAGMDSTTPCFSAGEDRPGTSYAAEDETLKSFTEKVKRLGQWAEGRCDLLVLTIHWGKNWSRDTPPVHQAMTRIAFEHGVDLILGHSAHRLQGIEVMNGKVVVYDMGNLLFDCKLKSEGERCALFRLHLSTSGVHKIEVLPTQVLHGYTVLAGHEEARETLSEMRDLCSPFGTDLLIEEDIEGRPMGIVHIPEPKATSRGKPDPGLACVTFPARAEEIPATIDQASFAGEIPNDAQKLVPPAELAPGVELIAYRLPDTAREGRILNLSTWWRVTGPVDHNVMPAFHISPEGETPRRGTPWYTRHDAGDWTVPLSRLRPGAVIEDQYPARLAGLPPGTCKVYAVVIDTTRPEGNRILGEAHLLGEVEILPRTKE